MNVQLDEVKEKISSTELRIASLESKIAALELALQQEGTTEVVMQSTRELLSKYLEILSSKEKQLEHLYSLWSTPPTATTGKYARIFVYCLHPII